MGKSHGLLVVTKHLAKQNAKKPRVSLIFQDHLTLIMNKFVEKYSTTNPISQLRRAQRLASDDDGEEFSDAAWGSEAGFGNLTKGLPTFTVPHVPDVSLPKPPS